MKVEYVKKSLPQNPDIEVLVPNYKEPILPVNHGGFGWYGLQAFNEQGQLMCHECGVFRDSLGRHCRKHGLSGRAYRNKYGLCRKTKLNSISVSNKLSIALLNDPKRINRGRENMLSIHIHKLAIEAIRIKKSLNIGYSLEYMNKHDSCPAQLLRSLADAAKIFGDRITQFELNQYRPGLYTMLRKYFGTLNKAKQILKLIPNEPRTPTKYTKQLVLEDMICFFIRFGRWPLWVDYLNNKMLCGATLLQKHGGIVLLRKEAMKLKEEQDARAQLAKQIPKIANNIEMEFAGLARR